MNSIREKYINLSSYEINALSPADMLNITYEYNKKRAIFVEKNERFLLKSISDKIDSGSKHSSKM